MIRRPAKGLLIDLSGTIHIEDKAIPGSIEAIKHLRSRNIPFLFVTNTTKESQKSLCQRLNRIGFEIDSDEVFSSLSAAHRLIKSRQLRPLLLLSESALDDFSDVKQNDPNAVVIGLAPDQFNYDKLSQAFRLIKEKQAALIAIHKARYMATSDGLSLGPGCFVTGLEYSADVKAEVVGKPESVFFHSALEVLNSKSSVKLEPSEVVMFGDDVRDDVLGAQNAGFQGCLVKTGKYRESDEAKAPSSHVFASFSEAVSSLFPLN